MTEAAFWRSSPRRIMLHVKAAHWRQVDRLNEVGTAFHGRSWKQIDRDHAEKRAARLAALERAYQRHEELKQETQRRRN